MMTSLTQDIIAKKLAECANDPAVLMHKTADLIRQGMSELLTEYNQRHEDQYEIKTVVRRNEITMIAISDKSFEMKRHMFQAFASRKSYRKAIAVTVTNNSLGRVGGLVRFPDVGVTFAPNNSTPNTYWITNHRKKFSCLQSFTNSHGPFGAPELPMDARNIGQVLEKFAKLLPWDSVQVMQANKTLTQTPKPA